MKIHLVNDQTRSTERPKLGLGYISSYLKKYGDDIEVSVSFKGDDTSGTIRTIRPDIVALTATTESFNDVIRLGKEIKGSFNIPLIIGGTHITILPKCLPQWIDAGVIGEGEQTLLEMVGSYRRDGSLFNENIKGIIYRDGQHLRQTDERELIEPLDRIPFPDWDMLGLSKSGPGHILTSRGCTYKCVFCASASIWRKIRFFSPEYVVSEIKTIVEKFGRKEILIYDDLFTANSKRIQRISELICQEGLDKVVKFECLSNVNHFSAEMASDLKKMNVHRISFGMESGSPAMLKYLKKGTVTTEKIRNAVKAGVDNGMEVLGSFIIGTPGETEEDMMMTYNFIKDLKLTETGINVATPFPGTELWNYAVSEGHIKDEWDDSIYAMKTITPETIKDKRLLCSVDKNRFIEIYKMMIDLDSTLIDRRVRTRGVKGIVKGFFDKGVFPEKRIKVLDASCEDGALGAAIKSRLDAEVAGLNPEPDHIADSIRRLDKVLTGGVEELMSTYKKGYFELIIFNETIPGSLMMKHYRELLNENGFIIGTFANRMHFSYLAYSLLGIRRPPFETTDGTLQYMRWGVPDKDISQGESVKDVKSYIENEGYSLLSTYKYKGDDTVFLKHLSDFLSKYMPDTGSFNEESRVIRYFYTARKAPAIAGRCPEVQDRKKDLLTISVKNGQESVVRNDHVCRDRTEIEALIPSGARRVLELGCGTGLLGKALLSRGADDVVGVDIDNSACEEARRNLSRVICGNIEEMELPFEKGYFDCIVFAGVLEYLKDPLSTLKKMKEYLSDTGVAVASIPNTRYFSVINMLAEGYWRYDDNGIIDKAPLRFFAKKEMQALFAEAGFEMEGMSESSVHPKYYELNGSVPETVSFGKIVLKGLDPAEIKDLFVPRYLIMASKAGSEFKRLKDLVDSSVRSGNINEAERLLEEYLELHLADTDALFMHAEVCCKLGLYARAIENLERILLFEPQRPDALELKKRISMSTH
ncbi:MAG: methyltransferase domain-containing protein [Nitrospirae bacterium]|nr:methyltransferase domain-containing protein [Nitrospirota bacterium]